MREFGSGADSAARGCKGRNVVVEGRVREELVGRVGLSIAAALR